MSCCNGKRPLCRWSLLLLVAGWFLLALFVGEVEILSMLPGRAIPLMVIGLSAGLLAAYWLFVPLRRCLDGLDIRALIALHLSRFVGVYFLYLHSRGHLPREFAIPAGWGDITVGAGAAALLLAPALLKSRKVLGLWNALGLLDILYVVKVAALILVTQQESMFAMTQLPLSFLPSMIVPIIILSHVVIFARIFQGGNRTARVADYEQSAPASGLLVPSPVETREIRG